MLKRETIYSMNVRLVAFAIFLALISLSTSQQIIPFQIGQEIIRNVQPGHLTIDLGDGYNESFDLPNSEKSYYIEVNEPGYGDILLTTRS